MGNIWSRMVNMSNDRVNKRVFSWARAHALSGSRNWVFHVLHSFREIGCESLCDPECNRSRKSLCDMVTEAAFDRYKEEWIRCVSRPCAVRGEGGNKLRLYSQFKSIYGTEQYCTSILPTRHRSAFARFRCGVAPIMIELGRYTNTPIENCKCVL